MEKNAYMHIDVLCARGRTMASVHALLGIKKVTKRAWCTASSEQARVTTTEIKDLAKHDYS